MAAFEDVMKVRGRGMPSAGEVSILGKDPVFSTPYRIGEVCAAALAGTGVAVNDIWELRTGRRQKLSVDVRHAAAALRSTAYVQRPDDDGVFRHRAGSRRYAEMAAMIRPYPTRDGRWFLPHFGMPHLKDRVLKVLDCEFTPEGVQAAVARWDALDLEGAIAEARACGGMVRSNNEWLTHPHGEVLQAKPLVEVIKIGDSDVEPMPEGARPLSGVRVLDLTRILAGPITARTLAEHGADVLMVAAERLPQNREHVMDTSHGKRSTFLDLTVAEEANRLRDLVREADVFSQGYRPGALADLGFGPEELAELRPGLIYVSISCFGAGGPFSDRAGWEEVAQSVTGIAHGDGTTEPRLLPATACDYITGYLGAYGTLLALAQRAQEGGSYHVRVSLCQSAMLIYRQGLVEFDGPGMDLSEDELAPMRIETQTVYGPLRHLAPAVCFSETPARWDKPSPKLGGDLAEWL